MFFATRKTIKLKLLAIHAHNHTQKHNFFIVIENRPSLIRIRATENRKYIRKEIKKRNYTQNSLSMGWLARGYDQQINKIAANKRREQKIIRSKVNR